MTASGREKVMCMRVVRVPLLLVHRHAGQNRCITAPVNRGIGRQTLPRLDLTTAANVCLERYHYAAPFNKAKNCSGFEAFCIIFYFLFYFTLCSRHFIVLSGVNCSVVIN